MDKIKPFPGFIVIEPEPKPEKEGGIYLPQDEGKTFFGKVVAIGAERENEHISCKVGDRVMFNKWASNEIDLEGKKYQFLRANEILAVVNK